MSKNISIQEGGTAKTMTVNKLKTNVVGGGSCLWVPEDEVPVGTKHITQNGTYEASSDNLYGYSQVTVSGIGKVSGTKPISSGGDGNEYAVDTEIDPTTGEKNIVETVLPSSIAITTQPSTTTYGDGATISTNGMVVKAYKRDENIWESTGYSGGVIPLSEINLDPTTAHLSGSTGEVILPDSQTSGTVTVTGYLSPVETVNYALNNIATRQFTGEALQSFLTVMASYDCPCIVIINTDQSAYQGWSPLSVCLFTDLMVGNTFNLGTNRRCLLWLTYGKANRGGAMNISNFKSDSSSIYTVLGRVDDRVSSVNATETTGGLQTIDVKWNRPKDSKELTTSFDITVVPANTDENNTGGDGGYSDDSGGSSSSGGGGGHPF